jgi:uncharacterized protein (TIGR02466 family)
MNNDEDIKIIFPTPIFFNNINKKITKKELDYLDYIKNNECHDNNGNKASINTYILNLDVFKELKEQINNYITFYFKNVLEVDDSIKPYITQSWLNFTEEDNFHHIHAHTNSIVSGVYYFNADINSDNITFYKDMYEQIKLKYKNSSILNANTWTFDVKTGDLILFPSNVPHGVNVKRGKNIRISLAFNVFIKGDLGEDNYLNILSL